jgi:4-amino-4-deoxy-L-arabinose transferase-like glycosyltransferase
MVNPSRPSGRRGLVAVLAAAGVYAGLAIAASRAQSSTFDEPIHLPPGYLSLTLGDHRMNPDHPPLVRRLAALPLLFMDVKMDRDDFAFKVGRPWEFGKRFLYRWNDAETLLFWGRLPIVALGALLLASVFVFTRQRYGEQAALLALFLGALNPDLLAHGAIVSTDLGIALFTFLAVAAFVRVIERVDPLRVTIAGLAVGAACATKFSGLGLLPMLGLPALLVALDDEPLDVAGPGEPREVRTRTGKLAILGLVFLGMGVAAVFTVWSAYGFHSPLAVDAEANARIFDWSTVELRPPVLQAFFAGARRLGVLPEAWIWGLQHFLVHAESRPAFLMGQHSETGWWYYFPATFALKTPLPLILLFATGLATARRTASSRRTEMLLFIPLAVFVVLSMSRSINIGHRHLLPVYPFVLVIAGRVAALAFGPAEKPRTPALAVGALCLWQAVATAAAFPHYLAYFNELAGGSRNGWRLLVDSNLDWGQGLKGLREWMSRSGVPRVKLAYFGTADVKYYGVSAERLPGYQPPPPATIAHEVRPGDLVAVSATLLQGLYVDDRMLPLVERLRKLPPLAVIGHSIFIYRADFAWDLPGEDDVAEP